MKLFSIILKVSIVILLLTMQSCSDKDNPTKPIDNDPPIRLFDISVGNKWVMSAGSEELTITVIEEDTRPWAMNFYATDSLEQIKTFIVEVKEFDKGLPRYREIGIAATDSGYYFGIRNHFLVAPNYPSDYFVKLFFIADEPTHGYIERSEQTKEVLGDTWYWRSEAKWKGSTFALESDSIVNIWEVAYYAEEKSPIVRKTGEDFVFAEKIGFYKYKNYVLRSYTISGQTQ